MNSTYAQKSSTVQKVADSKAASVLDSSAQNESLQRKADMANNATQRAEAPRPNNTGMPDNLKAGIESLSGFSMDDVRVHYNSSKPATVQALAYTQGTDIHVAPGQEKCLPHEAWHVAQQMAGRVSPTTNINGMPVNDNAALEHEADVMGERAVQCKKSGRLLNLNGKGKLIKTIQCKKMREALFEKGWTVVEGHNQWFERKETKLAPYGGNFEKAVKNLDEKYFIFGSHKSSTDRKTGLRHDYQSEVSEFPFDKDPGYGNYQFQSFKKSHSKVFSKEDPGDLADYRNAHIHVYNSDPTKMIALIHDLEIEVGEDPNKISTPAKNKRNSK